VKHLPLVAAVTLFSTVCASGAYWGSQLFRPLAQPAAAAAPTATAPPDITAAAGLFGGTPAAAAVATAFTLKGVIEDGPEGVAILVAEGQEAAPGVTVKEIHRRYVLLNEGATSRRLDLPDSGTSGPERVAAAPATPTAPAMAPAPATPPSAPVLAARAGAAAPVGQPDAVRPPGLSTDQMRHSYEERRRQEMEQTERARRAAGVIPAAS
jgi:general secretion pathway protein C